MIKKILYTLLVIVLLAVAGFFLILKPRLPIINGFAAKAACSCTYMMSRPLESIKAEDLNFSPINQATISIDRSTKSASATFMGLTKKTAVFRKGIGCILLQGEDDYKYVVPKDITRPRRLADSLIFEWPEKQLKLLDEAMEYGFNPKWKTRTLLVIHKDTIIGERYSDGVNKDSPQLGWSMTKSIMNALVGSLVQQGRVSLDQDHLFPEWKDERSKITLNDLLHMNSGLEWNEDYGSVSDVTKLLYMSEDIVALAKDKPLQYPIGQHWYYSSGTSNLISGFIRDQFSSRSEYLAYPHVALFDLLGMDSAVIETDESGNYIGSSYGFATARDWAKFGRLYLNDGVWQGLRILPEGWVDYSVEEVPESKGIYGSHIWLNKRKVAYPDVPEDMLSFNGFQGQKVFVIPSEDLIIVRLGLSEEFDNNGFIKRVLEDL